MSGSFSLKTGSLPLKRMYPPSSLCVGKVGDCPENSVLRVGCRCRHGCLSLHYLCPFYHSSHYPPISLLVICPYLSITVVLFLASALFLLLARQWQDDEPYRLRYVRLLVYCYTVVVAGWEGGMVCTTMICTQYGLWRLGAVVVLLSLSQRCLIVAANPWVIKFSLNKTLVIYHGIFC